MTPNKRSPTAREHALAVLSRRAVSGHELRERLAAGGFEPEDIEDALQMAVAYGYVDDARIVRDVLDEAERSGRGPRWIEQRLKRRGLAQTTDLESTRVPSPRAVARAIQLVEQRFGTVQPLEGEHKDQALRYLVRRGFDWEQAHDMVGRRDH